MGGTGSLVCQLLPLCCYYLMHNPSQLCNDGNAEVKKRRATHRNTVVNTIVAHTDVGAMQTSFTAYFNLSSASEYFDCVFKAEVSKTPREYLSKLLPRDTNLPTQRSVHCRQAFWMQQTPASLEANGP